MLVNDSKDQDMREATPVPGFSGKGLVDLSITQSDKEWDNASWMKTGHATHVLGLSASGIVYTWVSFPLVFFKESSRI